MRNRRYPRYPDDTDYTTNSPSYYDDMARKQKLIELLAKKIWEYEETLDLTLEEISNRLESYIEENDQLMTDRLEQWDLNLEKFPENVELLLQEWLSDGTLDHIINDTIFNWKADKIYVDSEIERLEQIDVNLSTMLTDTNDELSKTKTHVDWYVNVKSFGAVGDGETDDTNAINEAIEHAKLFNLPKVIFPDGEYLVSSENTLSRGSQPAILIKSNIEYVGVNGATITSLTGNQPNMGTINEQDGYTAEIIRNVKIENLTFKGVSGNGNDGIHLAHVENYKIMDCYFEDIGRDSIYLGHPSQSVAHPKTINGYIKNCTFENSGRLDVSLLHGDGLHLENNQFTTGVDIEPTAPTDKSIDFTIVFNTFKNAFIKFHNTMRDGVIELGIANISKNKFFDYEGEHAVGTSHPIDLYLATNSIISENHITDCTGGIHTDRSQNSRVINNIIRNRKNEGTTALLAARANNYISGNLVQGYELGVRVLPGAQAYEPEIEESPFTKGMIVNNHLFVYGDRGIWVSSANLRYVKVIGNYIEQTSTEPKTSNDSSGIYVKGENHIISQNHIVGQFRYGIRLYGESSNCKILDNDIVGSSSRLADAGVDNFVRWAGDSE